MKVVLLSTIRPEWVRLADVARRFRHLGIEVHLVTTFDPQGLRPAGVAGTHRLRRDLSGRRGGVRPRRFTARWWRIVVRNLALRIRMRYAGRAVQTWLTAKYDPAFRALVRSADALVAMEAAGTYAVWRAARIWGVERAVFGPEPLLQQFGEVTILEDVDKAVRLGLYTPDEVVDAWRTVSANPSHPTRARLLPKAPRIIRALRSARAYQQAAAMTRDALRLPLDAEARVRLRLELTTIQLSLLTEPDTALAEAVSDVLDIADRYYAEGKLGGAADLTQRVAEAMFHRELHADVLRSPLVDEPETFLARLHRSPAWLALSAPAAAGGPLPAGKPPAATSSADPGPPRVLVVSGGNVHFAEGIVEDVETTLGAQVRWLNLAEAGPAFGRRNRWAMMYDRLCQVAGTPVAELGQPALDALAWPDVVFVDWCDFAAQWTALHLPRHVRLVIRLHSIEALSPEPHMIDWSRVDDVVFVSEHVRACVARQVPALARAGAIHVLPNEMHLDRFGLPKSLEADRTVVMIGWGQRVKDPIWALEVLAHLRKYDERWRLLLVGSGFAESQLASGYAYRDAFYDRVAHDDVAAGVEFVGYVDNLPEVLRRAGFALSASRRESFGVGVTEAAASAAVPVIRDWPMYAGYGGARGVFPDDWVVSTPEEAAQRILTHAEPAQRRRIGQAARDYALAHWDWPLVAPEYRRILSGAAGGLTP